MLVGNMIAHLLSGIKSQRSESFGITDSKILKGRIARATPLGWLGSVGAPEFGLGCL